MTTQSTQRLKPRTGRVPSCRELKISEAAETHPGQEDGLARYYRISREELERICQEVQQSRERIVRGSSGALPATKELWKQWRRLSKRYVEIYEGLYWWWVGEYQSLLLGEPPYPTDADRPDYLLIARSISDKLHAMKSAVVGTRGEDKWSVDVLDQALSNVLARIEAARRSAAGSQLARKSEGTTANSAPQTSLEREDALTVVQHVRSGVEVAI